MEQPPRFFAAGSDSLAMMRPPIEARLAEFEKYADLSTSTDFATTTAAAAA